MKQLIQHFPEQLTEALGISAGAKLAAPTRPIDNVLICGMGGSGIGANLIQTFLYDELTVPVTVCKSYDIPAFVSERTLVIGCSYSGGTEETLAAVEQALSRGAQAIGITSGGKLGELLDRHQAPYIVIPSRDKSPRAGIGYAFVQLLHVMHHYGLSKSSHRDAIEAAAALIGGDNQQAIMDEAQTLAEALVGKLPIFYSDARLEPVVLRAAQQIAENSKQIAHQNTFPEMNHNELVGWVYPEWLWERTAVVMLSSNIDNTRTSIRMEICRQIFRDRGAQVLEMEARGASFIEQCIYLIHLIDWTSYYLAERNHVDPFPVEVIDYLKGELARR